MREDVGAVGDLEAEVDVLLDEHDRGAAGVGERAHDRQQALDDRPARGRGSARPAAAARGLLDQRARDREHLLLAAGEEAGAAVLQRRSAGKCVEHLVELLAARTHAEAEVLGDR